MKPAAPLPTLAIVGRPNVGKSTLFNLLADGAKAVVHGTAGTTRDIRRVEGSLFGLAFDVLDTAGLEEGAGGLQADLNRKAWQAQAEADVLLFVLDGKEGIVPADRALAQKLRKQAKPVVLVVNKGDVHSAEDVAHEAESFGFGQPVLVSAAHQQGLDGLEEALRALPVFAGGDAVEAEDDAAERPIRLAIVGKPNAGKSTLINALLGSEVMLAGPMAGLTREAIEHPFAFKGQEYALVDTPGLRKKAKVVDDLEGLMVEQTIMAIRKADMVVLMVDASSHSIGLGKWKVFESQDAKIADVIVRGHKPLIVALNKWDAVEDTKACLDDAAWQLGKVIHSIHTVKTVPMSAVNKQGVAKLMLAVAEVMGKQNTRVSTSKLNKLLAEMVARRPPPLAKGKAVKLKFATQVKTNPPVFAFWGNRVESIPASYKMYLRNQLVAALGLQNLPIEVVFKGGDNPYAASSSKSAQAKGSRKPAR